jgi:hypothetical protein
MVQGSGFKVHGSEVKVQRLRGDLDSNGFRMLKSQHFLNPEPLNP